MYSDIHISIFICKDNGTSVLDENSIGIFVADGVFVETVGSISASAVNDAFSPIFTDIITPSPLLQRSSRTFFMVSASIVQILAIPPTLSPLMMMMIMIMMTMMIMMIMMMMIMIIMTMMMYIHIYIPVYTYLHTYIHI
jgi:hypothetical protein